MKKYTLIGLLVFFYFSLDGQTFTRLNAPIYEQGNPLPNAWAGGMNQPQLSEIDLNADGMLDLFLFDKSGNSISTFLNSGSAGVMGYTFAPQYPSMFPSLKDWVLLRDYNCDGKMDIFTAGDNNNIWVYTNTSAAGNLSFSPTPTDTLLADGNDIYVNYTDIPAIIDVDNDGDLDILTFDNQGFYIIYYKNLSQEQFQNCNQLVFTIGSDCWGLFREEGLNNDVYLNMSCKKGRLENSAVRHAGSTVSAFDVDGNGVKDLLLGDISFDNLVFLHNNGTLIDAEMDAFVYQFPDYDIAVNLTTFPAGFWIDTDNTGNKDLVVTPNTPGVGANFDNILLYQNIGTNNSTTLEFANSHFLQNEMIDCGSASRPVFFDYNQDGKWDIIVGNDRYKNSLGEESCDLAVYENTGTSQMPAFTLQTRTYLDLVNVFENNQIQSIHPAFGDLDGDGDADLLLGDYDGNIHFFKNSAGVGNPAVFALEQENYKNIDVGAMAMPFIIDLNGDGKQDIVIGEQMGNLNYFENIGSSTVPNFNPTPTDAFLGEVDVDTVNVCCTGYAAPHFYKNNLNEWEFLIGTDYGKIFQYDNISTSSVFHRKNNFFGNIETAGRCAPALADLNGDNQYELIVGNLKGGLELFQTNYMLGIQAAALPPAFEVIPNPSQGDKMRISFQKNIEVRSLEILNMQGQKLLEAKYPANQTEYDVSRWSAGVYIVKAEDISGRVFFQKWIRD